MRRARWLLPALIAGALAACGGDDEPSNEEIRKPPLTVPGESAESDSGATTDTDATEPEPESGDGTGESSPSGPDEPMDQPNPGNGGVPAPDSNNPPADEPPLDSPENDTPPEPGSPEERFEQFCAQNPGAC